MRFVKKINERGTITLPTEIRQILQVGDGDVVEFEVLRVLHRSGDGQAMPMERTPGGSQK